MIKQDISDRGFIFTVVKSGQDVPFEQWKEHDECIYYNPLSLLADNGNAIVEGGSCIVPFESVYLLDKMERQLLGIPAPYDMDMRLRSRGMLNERNFMLKLEYLTFVPDGELLPASIMGNVLSAKGNKYLLSPSQYELAEKVAEFNAWTEEEKTFENNLRHFSQIKKLAEDSGCQLDSYLANENVKVPDKVKIELGRDEKGFYMAPAIGSPENERFQKNFERMRRVQGVYPVQRDDGSRVRIVMDDEQKRDLQTLKAGGIHRTKEDMQRIAAHPTEYFDPAKFDLTDFYSDRVIEIGLYKPKFYPFVSPYKSTWVAGAEVETPENGTTKIAITNEQDLQKLEQQIVIAKRNGSPVVEYRGAQIGISDADFLAKAAEKQLAEPKKPVETEHKGRKVLIIEENGDELGFTAEGARIEKESSYVLHENSNLNPAYELKQHQKEGVAWLQHLLEHHASGCLMADDMGLGKTLQLLYFIDWHARTHSYHKPYLVVAPVTLLENWENEYNRFFSEPRLNIARLTSREVPRQFNKAVIDRMQKLDIILTNYESLRSSQLNFCAVDFSVIVLDEAQRIKTPGTMVTNAAKALKGDFRVAMTGTPVENTLLDLWCIMDFCVPGLLGNAKEFAAKYQSPLKNADTDVAELGEEVHKKLGIYFLRRLKSDVAKDLPEKHTVKKRLEMPAEQEDKYEAVVKDYMQGTEPNILLTIFAMREVSEHPYIYDNTWQEHTAETLEETSARLVSTIEFIDQIKERQEKVIVFAEYKETQKMLQSVFRDRYGVYAKIINGDTPTLPSRYRRNSKLSRQQSIDAFQQEEGFNIIIMSPIAAGMGLNVTAANNVIHYSRHWNPAKENQATDRAYRIGQTKDVFVYYPMAISQHYNSFDETLDDLLSRKSTLASSTIFPTERVEVRQDEFEEMLFGKNKV